MKVYISLPITGTTDYMDRASVIEQALIAHGHMVINPAKVCAELPADTTHDEYMSVCFPLMDMCGAVIFDNGWQNSQGCVMELLKAVSKNMNIGFLKENIWVSQNRQEPTNLQRQQGKRYTQGIVTDVFSAVRDMQWKVPHGSPAQF